MDHELNYDQKIKKLRELIKDIDIAMMTTAEPDGTLHSRPMSTQQTEFDGDLWFFTLASAPKVDEVQQNRQVNISYAKTDQHRYVSISGKATLVRDRKKMEELWNPVYKIWFAKGLEDPDIALLKVQVEQAEYWDSPSSPMVKLAGFVKAIATGSPLEIGENEKLDLSEKHV